ncbi:hypothetical protein RCH21_001001 [Arthrobacter sp. PL16]|nr:hypothetical protein [Arthrobacter sp. PL16]
MTENRKGPGWSNRTPRRERRAGRPAQVVHLHRSAAWSTGAGGILCRSDQAVAAVSLFQPQAVEGAAPGCNDAVLLPGVEQEIPELQSVVGGGVELPAEFAHIREPHGGDRDAADRDPLGPEILQPLVAEVVTADLADDFPGKRPPQPDAAGAAGDVRDVYPLGGVRGRLLPGVDPEVVEVHVAVHAQLEQFLFQPCDCHVAADAGVVIEQQAVGHSARLLGDIARTESLQQGQCARTGHGQPFQRRHVVQGCRGTRPPRFCCGDGGGEPGGPLVAVRRLPLRRKGFEQSAIGFEPVWALTSCGLEEERAELLLADVERTDA